MLSVLRHMMLGVLAVAAFSCATTGEQTTDQSRFHQPAISNR